MYLYINLSVLHESSFSFYSRYNQQIRALHLFGGRDLVVENIIGLTTYCSINIT